MISQQIPRFPLAHLPTPVEEMPHLSRQLDRNLFIKRDDCTGLALGGNKTRKLEYIVAEALALGCDMLITTGAPQSNHCRQTAAAAARAGLRCVLILGGSAEANRSWERTGNMLLDRLLGAEIRWTGSLSREKALDDAVAFEREAGNKPFLIPLGASTATGATAYAFAMEELTRQGLVPDRIVLATSSAGTQAGLLAGARLTKYNGRIHGISVDKPAEDMRNRVASLANQVLTLLGSADRVSVDEAQVDDRFLGAGYGKMGALEQEAILMFARKEGILLDPVYTARAAGGMFELIRSNEIRRDETILFWHTGGSPALWAYGDSLV